MKQLRQIMIEKKKGTPRYLPRKTCAEFQATLIINGNKTFAQVPLTMKQKVADYLLSLEMPELVPVSYGGTLED